MTPISNVHVDYLVTRGFNSHHCDAVKSATKQAVQLAIASSTGDMRAYSQPSLLNLKNEHGVPADLKLAGKSFETCSGTSCSLRTPGAAFPMRSGPGALFTPAYTAQRVRRTRAASSRRRGTRHITFGCIQIQHSVSRQALSAAVISICAHIDKAQTAQLEQTKIIKHTQRWARRKTSSRKAMPVRRQRRRSPRARTSPWTRGLRQCRLTRVSSASQPRASRSPSMSVLQVLPLVMHACCQLLTNHVCSVPSGFIQLGNIIN